MKILIIGDSFAADWSIKYNQYKGWPNLLAEKYDVTNLAQAGVSEYKIYKQLQSVKWLGEYNLTIVSHTSPYRVPCRTHPIHSSDALHYNADLMLNDITYHSKNIKNFFNKSLRAAKLFFKYHYDIDFYTTTHSLYRKAIEDRLKIIKFISINLFSDTIYPSTLDFYDIYKAYPGTINHLSKEGNEIVFNQLIKKIIASEE